MSFVQKSIFFYRNFAEENFTQKLEFFSHVIRLDAQLMSFRVAVIHFNVFLPIYWSCQWPNDVVYTTLVTLILYCFTVGLRNVFQALWKGMFFFIHVTVTIVLGCGCPVLQAPLVVFEIVAIFVFQKICGVSEIFSCQPEKNDNI